MVKRFAWYPADDEKKKFKRKQPKAPKTGKKFEPGQVLILLAGRFRGKRVVFLKHLKSGLLLVTGPYKLNGVPLRRVNQRYVIGTSTKVDVKGVDASKVEDNIFLKDRKAKKSQEEKFFAADKAAVSATLVKPPRRRRRCPKSASTCRRPSTQLC